MVENTDLSTSKLEADSNSTNSAPDLLTAAENEFGQGQNGSLENPELANKALGKSEVATIDTQLDQESLKMIQDAPKTKIDYSKQVIILKPIPKGKFKLGLESQPEQYVALPGTVYRWAPSKVGNTYKTGMNRPEMGETVDERKIRLAELSAAIGKPLNNEFYDNLSVRLDPNKKSGERLFLSKPMDFIIWLAMIDSNSVANGLKEYSNGTKPEADWYIENREAEAEAKASLRATHNKALKEFGALSDQKKRKLAIMAGVSVMGLSPLATENELWDWMDGNPKERDARTKLFLQWIESGDTYINVAATVRSAILFNVIRKQSSGDFYYGDTMLGTTEQEVIRKLARPENGDLRMGVESKVQMKMQ